MYYPLPTNFTYITHLSYCSSFVLKDKISDEDIEHYRNTSQKLFLKSLWSVNKKHQFPMHSNPRDFIICERPRSSMAWKHQYVPDKRRKCEAMTPQDSSKISFYSKVPRHCASRRSWWLDALPFCQVKQPSKAKLHTTYVMKDNHLLA